MKPGDLGRGRPPTYVNLLEVSALENDDMVCVAMGAAAGNNISVLGNFVMNETRAVAMAEGILRIVRERQKRATDAALKPGEPKP